MGRGNMRPGRVRSLWTLIMIVMVSLGLIGMFSPSSSVRAADHVDDNRDDSSRLVEQLVRNCVGDFVMSFELPQRLVVNCRAWRQLAPTMQGLLLGALRECDEYYRQDLEERKICYAVVLGYLVGPKPIPPDPDEIWFIE